MRKKKIGLVGFFGWGNFGDELFVETYRQALGDDFDLHVLPDMTEKPYFSKPLDDYLEGLDAIVIGGGDLIIPWTVSDLYWKEEYLRHPVFIVGVGVPTWKPGNQTVIERMAAFMSHPNVKFINARDKESAAWITKHLKPSVDVSATADLVFAMQLPKKEPQSDSKILGIVTRERKGDGDDLAQILRLCEKASSLEYKIRHIVLGIGKVGRLDLMRAGDLFFPEKELVFSENLMELCSAIGECKVLASMKFHGTVVAASYGIPSIVLSATDKSRNLMRFLERPELLSSYKDVLLPDKFSPYVPTIPSHSRSVLKKKAKRTLSELKEWFNRL